MGVCAMPPILAGQRRDASATAEISRQGRRERTVTPVARAARNAALRAAERPQAPERGSRQGHEYDQGRR
ncbi:protein of unknown function [Rhodovastum atsumiense]|nr:protein of unknown function [Rhodovastum atsumiense]